MEAREATLEGSRILLVEDEYLLASLLKEILEEAPKQFSDKVIQAFDTLMDKGLVQLGEGADQRSRQVALSDAGRQVLEQGAPLWERAQQQLALRLGADKRAALLALLDDLETID